MVKVADVNLFFLTVWLGRATAETPRTRTAPPKSIAVIGAGIGGASAAHFLRQRFGKGIKIDVYESETVGGRLAMTSISGQEYEMGGTTVHPLNLHMKEFVQMLGMTALLAAESDLWTVEGGNKLVCSGLLYSAKANLIKGKVTTVEIKKRPQRNGEVVALYEVNYTADPDTGYNMYDIVIVAVPLHPGKSGIRFHDLSQPVGTSCRQYQQRVVTLVQGCLNASYFGHRGPGPFRPTAIATTAQSGNVILGASFSAPVAGAPDAQPPGPAPARVWKVLSPEPLAGERLSRLFPARAAVREAHWLAHPRYGSADEVPPFVLYHLNAIEWAASTVEMAAIAAKNAALLARHRWFQQLDKIDQVTLLQRLKVEL